MGGETQNKRTSSRMSFYFGTSGLIGFIKKSKEYQWFEGNRQTVFTVKNQISQTNF